MRKIIALILGFVALLLAIALALAATVDLEKITEEEALPKPVIEVIKIVQPEPKEPVSMVAVGDMMLGRFVETLMDRHDEDYPFANIKGLITDQDIAFGNLEGPIATKHVQTPDFITSFSFKPSIAKLLKKHGFTVVSLANNHTLDKGTEVFLQTQEHLDRAGVAYFGNPRDESNEYRFETDVRDSNLVFLGFNEAVNPFFDTKEALETVALESEDAFVIVSMHWGREYELVSNKFQKDFAHKLIDSGADLVIGHHPHVVQEVEVYNDKMIFYSLGNFIFDQYFSIDVEQGLTFDMRLYENGTVEYSLVPIQSARSQPQLMKGQDKVDWLKELSERVEDSSLAEQVKGGVVVIKS